MIGLSVIGWALLAASAPASQRACEVELEGMPVAAMSHHRLVVGESTRRPLARRLEVPLAGERVQLRVVGPRYAGARWLTRADCDSEHPAKLLVAPRPAMLVVGCPPKGMTIQCTDCPGIDEDALFLPEHFPSVIMTGHSRRIELVLRAPGFCVERRRILLLPGRNELKVELTPLASACPQ